MYLFFDTETTGMPLRYGAPVSELKNWPRLVQLGWLCTDAAGREIEAGESIVAPVGFKIPIDVVRIHGITTERAAAEGLPLADVLSRFTTTVTGAEILVAHNMAFDECVLGAEYLRSQLESPLEQRPRLCTMRASTQYCKLPGSRGFKWPSLTELHRVLFRQPLKGAHTALADVRACARCFFELKRLGVIS